MEMMNVYGDPPSWYAGAWTLFANTFLAHYLAKGMPAADAMLCAETDANAMMERRQAGAEERRKENEAKRKQERVAEEQRQEAENRKLRGPRLEDIITDPTVLAEYTNYHAFTKATRLGTAAEQLGACHAPGCACPNTKFYHWDNVAWATRLAALCAAHGFPVKWKGPPKLPKPVATKPMPPKSKFQKFDAALPTTPKPKGKKPVVGFPKKIY